MDYYIFPPELT